MLFVLCSLGEAKLYNGSSIALAICKPLLNEATILDPIEKLEIG